RGSGRTWRSDLRPSPLHSSCPGNEPGPGKVRIPGDPETRARRAVHVGGVKMSREPVSRGGRVRELPRANRTYGEGRVCPPPGCTTKLSKYNRFDHCWQHERHQEYISRGKRKARKQGG